MGAPSSGGHGNGDDHAGAEAIALMTAILIGISMMIEFVTHHVEHIMDKKHVLPILHHIYKESLILAILSIFLNLEHQYHIVEGAMSSPFDSHLFHELHMALFYSVIFYLVIVCSLMVFAMRHLNHLKKYEERSLNEAKRNLDKLIQKRDSSAWLVRVSPFLASTIREAQFEVEYQSVRRQTIRRFKLPDDFVFYVYLRKCGRAAIIGMSGVHYTVWAVILIFCALASIAFIYVGSGPITAIYITMLYATLLLAMQIKGKMEDIVKVLLKKNASKESTEAGAGTAEAAARLLDNLDVEAGGSDDEGQAAYDDDDTSPIRGRSSAEAKERAEHLALFWGQKTVYVRRLVQFITLLEAIMIPLHINFFFPRWAHMKGGEKFALHFFSLTPHLATCLVALPSILPNYIFASSMGALAHPPFIKDALKKTPSVMASSPPVKVEHGHGHH